MITADNRRARQDCDCELAPRYARREPQYAGVKYAGCVCVFCLHRVSVFCLQGVQCSQSTFIYPARQSNPPAHRVGAGYPVLITCFKSGFTTYRICGVGSFLGLKDSSIKDLGFFSTLDV